TSLSTTLWAANDYSFPLRVGSAPPRRASSTDLSPRATLNHPGDPNRYLLIASLPVSGFIPVGGLADLILLTRPNQVRLRCGSRIRPHEASASRVSPPAARRL